MATPSMNRTFSSSSSSPRSMNETMEDAMSRQYVFRLIDAGATGLADILIAEAEEQQQQQQSQTNNGPSLLAESNNTTKNVPLETSSNRRMELVKKELVPISWMMWIVNILSLSFYINEVGTTVFAGIDLVKFFQMCCLRSNTTAAPGTTGGATSRRSNKRVCCGCRQSTLPTFHRINNSYVSWDADKKVLIGTPPSNDEFGFLKTTVFQQFFLYIIPSIILSVLYMAFPDIKGFSATPIIVYSSRFDMMLFMKIIFPVVWTAIPCIIIPLAVLLVLGPSLVGSRDGSLPTFMPHLLKASAPEYMISYSWKGGKSQFARALAEVLPNAWIDVRSLVGGQLVSNETRSNSSNARVTVVILDRPYIESRNCASEFLSVVTKRKHNGSSRCHQTLVLIDESFLQSASGIEVESDKMQEHRRLLEASGEYIVTPTNPAINWRDITTILTEVGCKVYHTPDALLEHLQKHACRADHADISLCIHWWMKYGSSSFGGSSAHVSDYRVPWNIVGNKSLNSKRKLHVKSWCERATRTCCKRRPYVRAGCFSWIENSVSTGGGGAWLPYDASSPPQAHVDVTPQYVLGWLIAIALSALLPALALACFWTIDSDATALTQVKQCFEPWISIGGGIIASVVCAASALFGAFFYVTDVFTPPNILHSSVLFPFFAFSEIQDVADDGVPNEDVGKSEAVSVVVATNEGTFISSSLSALNGMARPQDKSLQITGNSLVEGPNSNSNAEDVTYQLGMKTSTNPLRDLSSPTNPSSPTRLQIRNPPTPHTTATRNHHPAQATGQRRKFSIQFAHNDSPIGTSIENFNVFLAQFVFGFDPKADKDKGYPEVLSAKSILENPDHPLPLTVYVFFLDSPTSQQAWSKAMQEKNNRWQPEHVVLVTTFNTLNTGGDSASAAGILKKLLVLKDERSNREGDKNMVKEILHAFTALDRGEIFPVDVETIPSSQAAREALHEILKSLGFLLVPCGYASDGRVGYVSPRSFRGGGSSNARSVPFLVPTLGPLLTYGPTSTLQKKKTLEALKKKTLEALEESSSSRQKVAPGIVKHLNVATNAVNESSIAISESHPPVMRAVSMNTNSSSGVAAVIDSGRGNGGGNGGGDNGSGIQRSVSTSSPTSPRVMRRSPSPPNTSGGTTKKWVTKARPRMQEHMLIIYNTKKGAGGETAEMPDGSPYRGLVPAVLEAISSKLGHILKLNGEQFIGEPEGDFEEVEGEE